VNTLPGRLSRQPAPAAGEPGRLRILSQPPGAEVVIDGRRTGSRTPVNVELAPGRHTIALQHRGFENEMRNVLVQGNRQEELTVALKPVARKRFFLFR